jgi:transcriptional regulator with XRE-family HTH domain
MPHQAGLGAALRAARTRRGLSLAQVAEATGISRSLLSLIETGRSDITIGRMNKLSLLYEVRLSELLPEPVHHDSIVMRRSERQGVTSRGEGIDVELLAPEGERTMNPLLARLAPGGAMTDYVAQPEEEFAIVIEGRARLEFASSDPIELDEGDSAYYRDLGGHRWVNLHDGTTVILIVFRRRSASP